MRYVVEAPTKWANELTLWIAGFVFLCSGFYGMQQRSHIRLIADWNLEPTVHTAADDIDEEELAAIKRSVGAD